MAWLCILIAAVLVGCGSGTDDDAPEQPSERARRAGACAPAEVVSIVKARDPRVRELAVGYAHGLAHVEFRMGGRLLGKGAVDCDERRVVAWGSGSSHARLANPCPRPARAIDGVVTCVRRWR